MKHLGFTIIETILVITIMLILLGGGSVTFNRYSRQSKFEKDVTTFMNVLSLAREKTVNRDIGSYTCTGFTGYQVWSVSSTQYQLRILCPGATVVQQFTLLNGTITSPFSFAILFDYSREAIPTAPVTIVFKNRTLPECRQAIVTPTGVIRTIGPYAC